MVITYHDDTCFRVVSGKTCVVFDPASEKFKADLTIHTSAKLSNHSSGGGLIYGGGEYEIQGVSVRGLGAHYDVKSGLTQTVYSVILENITIFFMGNIGSAPQSELLEKIGGMDILFIPTGKGYLDAKNAVKLVKQLEPSIIIPYPAKQSSSFLDEIGQKCDSVDKLTLKKKDIVEMGGKTKIVCIKS